MHVCKLCVRYERLHFKKDNGTRFIITLFVLINQTSFFAKTIEHGAVISNQIPGRIKLSNSAFIQYKNSETVVIHSAFNMCGYVRCAYLSESMTVLIL